MNRHNVFLIASLFGLSLVSSVSQAASFTFSGNIANHNDIVRVDFSLATDATNVRVWTDSFLATEPIQTGPGTNFDPITALWNTDTGARIGENDDNSSIAPGQTYFDSGFSLATLAAGNYFFTMATFANFASGDNISNGFRYDAQTPIAIADFDQPANAGNLRGTFWRINLDGVDSASGPTIPIPSPIPLPGAVWLFGSALVGFAGFARKKFA